jgi:hypothetical protein
MPEETVGSLKLVGTIDISQIEEGLVRIKGKLSEAEVDVNNMSNSLSGLGKIAATSVVGGITAVTGALIALGLQSSTAAPYLAEMDLAMFNIGETMGTIIQPQLALVNDLLQGFNQFLGEGAPAMQQSSQMAAEWARGWIDNFTEVYNWMLEHGVSPGQIEVGVKTAFVPPTLTPEQEEAAGETLSKGHKAMVGGYDYLYNVIKDTVFGGVSAGVATALQPLNPFSDPDFGQVTAMGDFFNALGLANQQKEILYNTIDGV